MKYKQLEKKFHELVERYEGGLGKLASEIERMED